MYTGPINIEDCTWSRARGGASVQSDVWLSRALLLWVVARHLLLLGLWHRQAMLSATVRGWGGHQQRLLGRGGGRRQVQGSDLLSHQLLLDLVNEHQVIQLKGLTGHAQQKTATLCECHSRPKNIIPGQKTLTSTQYKIHFCLIYKNKPWWILTLRVCFTDTLVLNGWKDIHTWKQMAIKGGKWLSLHFTSGLTWPGMDGGGGQKYGLLNRGSAILKWTTFIADTYKFQVELDELLTYYSKC